MYVPSCIFITGVGIKMEREAYWANITCDSVLGGTNSTEPGINNLYRLSCRSSTQAWFDAMGQYEGLGYFLVVISIIGMHSSVYLAIGFILPHMVDI